MYQEDEEHYDNEIDPNVKILRLMTGEDIISLVVESFDEDDSPHYIIDTPFVILMKDNRKTGGKTISLKPWVYKAIVNENLFKIYAHDVLTTMEPSEAIVNVYSKAYEANGIDDNEKSEKKESTKEILDTMDRLEPSVKSNKNVKSFVKTELGKIMNERKSRGSQ